MNAREADKIHASVAKELYGEDGDRWPTMIGCGVSLDEVTREPVVVVSFLKGTEPKEEDFPKRINGVRIAMYLAKRIAE